MRATLHTTLIFSGAKMILFERVDDQTPLFFRIYLFTFFEKFDSENRACFCGHANRLLVGGVWVDYVCFPLFFIELKNSGRDGDTWCGTDTEGAINYDA